MPEHFIYLFIYSFECLSIQFFNLLTCDLRDTKPRQRSLTLLPIEVEDFPTGGNHSKHMPPLTYLAWLEPICYNSRLVFIHVNTAKVLVVEKTWIKNIEQQPNYSATINSKTIAPSKNAFQNISALQNCSLKKYISKHICTSKLLPQKNTSKHRCTSKMLPQKIHFKTFVIKLFLY